jgi:hypothetical protein
VNDWLIGIWRTALTFGIGKPDYAIKVQDCNLPLFTTNGRMHYFYPLDF